MSEREFSQEENVESGETQEAREAPEARALEQATTEPEAHVETTRDFQEAEEIETVVVELVENVELESAEESLQAEFSSIVETANEVSASSSIKASQPIVEEALETVVQVEAVESKENVGRDVNETEEKPIADSRQPETGNPERESQPAAERGATESEEEVIQVEVINVVADNQAGAETIAFPEEEPEIVSVLGEEDITATEPLETAVLPEEGVLNQGDIPQEAIEGVEENWEPPEMYVHHGQDGSITIVGADGKPLDSPPVYQKIVDGNGQEQIIAHYPGMESDAKFSIKSYEKPLDPSAVFVHVGSDGKPVVVDSEGKSVDSPPIVQIMVDSSGKEIFQVQYPGGEQTQKVELQSYVGSFEKEMFIHVGEGGKVTVVDAAGKPIDSPPQITMVADSTGQAIYKASYPGGGEETKAILSSYTGSLEGCYAYYGQDGKITVVDDSGKPIDSPPPITKVMGATGEVLIAGYPGAGPEGKVTLEAYKPSAPTETFISIGSDGKPVVVDVDGKPINSPPIVTMVADSTGLPVYKASYPGHTSETQTVLSLYSAPLDNCYIHIGQDGKATVVDVDGKALNSQPQLLKILGSGGEEIFSAWYPDDTGNESKHELGFYKPPSAA